MGTNVEREPSRVRLPQCPKTGRSNSNRLATVVRDRLIEQIPNVPLPASDERIDMVSASLGTTDPLAPRNATPSLKRTRVLFGGGVAELDTQLIELGNADEIAPPP